MNKIDWFGRGRDAFTEGKTCHINDGRISGPDRGEWYRGWRYQRNLNTPPTTEADRTEAIAGIQAIRDLLVTQ